MTMGQSTPIATPTMGMLPADQAELDAMEQAYIDGCIAMRLKRKGQSFSFLVDKWTGPRQPQLVRTAFWRGVEDT